MSLSLVKTLIENSKVAKRVAGEIGPVSYDDFGTPDNHTTGKHDKKVDGEKGLGTRPKDGKKAPQVEGPKKRERRSMTENTASDLLKGFMLKLGTPKWGRHLYDQLQQEEPEMYRGLLELFGRAVKATGGVGLISDRAMMNFLMNDDQAQELALQTRNWVVDKLPPEFEDWAIKKQAQLGGDYVPDPEGADDGEYGDEEDMFDAISEDLALASGDATFDHKSSAQKNRDEGLKKPKVDKTTPARGAKIAAKQDPHKTNKGKEGKPKILNKSYQAAIPVEVKQVHEDLASLAKLIGPFELDTNALGGLVEDYPDGMDWAAHDAQYGDDNTDWDHLKESIIEYMNSRDAKVALQEYRTSQDRDDRVGVLYNMFDAAYGAAKQGMAAYDNPDLNLNEDLLKEVFSKTLKGKVDEADLHAALSEYMGESALDEDQLSRSGSDNELRSTEAMLSRMGYKEMGGGFTGGGKNYRGPQGTVSVRVHSFKPTQVIGWSFQSAQGADKEGTEVTQLADLLGSGQTPQDRPQGRMPKVSVWGRKPMDEMSSGGATGSGSIATSVGGGRGRQSQLFAGTGDMEVDHIPQSVEEYVARLDPYMKKKYYLTWADAAGDPEPIERAIKQGLTPEEFADGWAEEYGLESSGEPWSPLGEDPSDGEPSPWRKHKNRRKNDEEERAKAKPHDDNPWGDKTEDAGDDGEEQPFMDYVSEVDNILKDKFGKSDREVYLMFDSENMQEYADAQEAGQSPYEMAQDWIRNGDTYRKNYADAAHDKNPWGDMDGDGEVEEDLGSPLSRNAPRGDGFIKGR